LKKEEEEMSRKSSVWLIVLISIVAFAFIATGCSKRQMVKQEESEKAITVAKPEAVPEEAAPEKPTPEAFAKEAEERAAAEAPAPQEEAVTEAPAEEVAKEEAPMEEAKPEEAAEVIDLAGMRIQFAFDDYSLSSRSKEYLEAIGAWMSKNSDVKIQIEGHTCNIGTAEYNLALGDRRANSAKNYLEGLGIDSSRLSTISYGFEKPLLPNTDEANRSKNRRDEFMEAK
jgi:peptidoglycan-associated lipoprotein